jgi:DNA mismatch repair protein MutS2
VSEKSFDLDSRSRGELDFDELLEWIAGFARTAPGRRRIVALEPLADPVELGETWETIREIQLCQDREGLLVPSSLPDPGAGLAGLAFEGRRLDPEELRDLAVVARAAGEMAASLRRLPAADYPRLSGRAEELPDLRQEADEVLRCIAPDGTIADEASQELRRIRRARTRTGERLRQMLESFLHRPDAGAVIRDDFITQRNGRFVIPVRSDTPRPVKGIVHASSSSGATQFVEPLETVELNNELVRLAELEQNEIERLLLNWTEMFRASREEVELAVAELGDLDGLQARALFGREVDGTSPEIEADGPLRFEALRHPLLDRRLREQDRRCVPLSLTLDPADRVLVLSGPNAGGKTVALKTIGLAVLMGQSGIPLPARTIRLPLYRQIRTDIGDHQSMQADLSTFSAHVGAVAEFLAEASPPTLLLFDEIGSGTDPVEGAALARSILEAACVPGISTVATTHQSALKAWAFGNEAALSAAMEFDTERLKPTYRVIMGAAGVSAGLEIARRVGLGKEIIDRARTLLGGDSRQAENYLTRLHRMTRELEEKLADVDRLRLGLEEERRRTESLAAEQTERQRERAREELDRALREFRKQAEGELKAFRDRREKEKAERKVAMLEGRVTRQHAELSRELGLADREAEAGGVPEQIEPGMQIYVRSLGRQGRIRRVAGRKVEVMLGNMPFTVDRDDLRLPGPAPPPDRKRIAQVRPGRGPVDAVEARGAASELMLIGKRVDEALEELDKFLDAAAVAGLGQVRLIHGHGTGRLRRAVREFLSGHAHVRAIRPGKQNEGGDGATVVTLG